MRFRTFITTLVLFLFLFFTSLFFISLFMFKIQIKNIKQRGISEHYFITSTFGKDLIAIVDRGNSLEDSIQSLYVFYSEYYQKQGVFLEVLRQDEVILSNFEYQSVKTNPLQPGIRKVSFKKVVDSIYVSVIGELPGTYEEYSLNYIHDITGNIATWKQTQKILLLIGIVFSIILAISLQLLLGRVFKPLYMVSIASKEIASGQYENRIPVSGQNELTEMAESFNNMTDEIQLRITQLAEASEQKQQFVDNFAHEIRTPLTSVYGFAEYIQKAPISDEEKINAAGIIMSESQHMLNISNRLLELATLRNPEIRKKEVSINELFLGAQNYIDSKLKEKQVTLYCNNSIECLYGDMDLLESLLINFTDNAMNACQPGGVISWDACLENGNKTLVVKDNGKGIPIEEIAKITNPFYRVDKSRNRAKGGAGLGLSICKQIATLHNAELTFESIPNQGTVVKLTFTGS